jgi:hypothetical protein
VLQIAVASPSPRSVVVTGIALCDLDVGCATFGNPRRMSHFAGALLSRLREFEHLHRVFLMWIKFAPAQG